MQVLAYTTSNQGFELDPCSNQIPINNKAGLLLWPTFCFYTAMSAFFLLSTHSFFGRWGNRRISFSDFNNPISKRTRNAKIEIISQIGLLKSNSERLFYFVFPIYRPPYSWWLKHLFAECCPRTSCLTMFTFTNISRPCVFESHHCSCFLHLLSIGVRVSTPTMFCFC